MSEGRNEEIEPVSPENVAGRTKANKQRSSCSLREREREKIRERERE